MIVLLVDIPPQKGERMAITIDPYVIDEHKVSNLCDACTELANWKVGAAPGPEYVTRTMKLCNRHIRELGDKIWHEFFDASVGQP